MKRGDEITVTRDLSLPTQKLYSGLTKMDHDPQRVEFVRHLANDEIIVGVRGHEFVVGRDEVVRK